MQVINPGSGQQGSQSGNNNGKPALSWSQPAPAKPASTPVPPPKAPNNNSTPKTQPTNSNTSAYVGTFVAGLVIGILLGWGIVGLRGDSSDMASSTMQSSSSTSVGTQSNNSTGAVDLTGSTISGSGDVVINAQDAGMTVSVAKVAVSEPTWVVVYDNNNGVPGRALGAELFFPASMNGETSGTINLLRGTTAGQTYLVGESLDDGDHIFSMDNDKPVRDAQGNPLMTSFKTN